MPLACRVEPDLMWILTELPSDPLRWAWKVDVKRPQHKMCLWYRKFIVKTEKSIGNILSKAFVVRSGKLFKGINAKMFVLIEWQCPIQRLNVVVEKYHRQRNCWQMTLKTREFFHDFWTQWSNSDGPKNAEGGIIWTLLFLLAESVKTREGNQIWAKNWKNCGTLLQVLHNIFISWSLQQFDKNIYIIFYTWILNSQYSVHVLDFRIHNCFI